GGRIALHANGWVAGDGDELLEAQVVAVENDRRHAPISARSFCTAATSSPRGAVTWPGRAASHSVRSPTFDAFSRPTAMSFSVTVPCAFSFEPYSTAMGMSY